MKKGFTLSEVLITLGILGVVAALTIPTLSSSAKKAHVGPRLAKAASMFEQATTALLNEQNIDKISEGYSTAASYSKALSKYLKISQFDYTSASSNYSDDDGTGIKLTTQNPWISKDGSIYRVDTQLASSSKNIYGTVFVDINGNQEPNKPGIDVFAFSLKEDGTLIPVGAHRWNGKDDAPRWQNNCSNGTKPKDNYRYTCTASIFENNLKVMYDYK